MVSMFPGGKRKDGQEAEETLKHLLKVDAIFMGEFRQQLLVVRPKDHQVTYPRARLPALGA